MSNLGNLYEIDTSRNMKNKYPILEIAENYFVCKVYGTNFRRSISKNPIYGHLIVDLNEYYKIINHRKDFNGFVYIPNSEKDYPMLPKKYFWELTLGNLNEKVEQLEAQINYMQFIFKSYSKDLDKLQKPLKNFKIGKMKSFLKFLIRSNCNE